MLALGGALFYILTRDSRAVSIGFLRYTTKGPGEVWAVFAITNQTRLDYHYSVVADPDVANSFWGNTPGLAPAGSVVTGEIWISKRDAPYQLVMQGYTMPVFPSNVLGAPWVSLKSAWRFVGGRTRLDLMPGTFTPGTNAALTVRSAPLPSEGIE